MKCLGAAIVMLVLFSNEVIGAPFCAVYSYGRQCFYFDMDSCRRAAGDAGACVINEAEMKRPTSGAPFCVVTSYATQCFYYDAGSCRRAAAQSGGACVVNR